MDLIDGLETKAVDVYSLGIPELQQSEESLFIAISRRKERRERDDIFKDPPVMDPYSLPTLSLNKH